MSKTISLRESSSSSSDDDSEVKDKPATHDKFGRHASTNSLSSAEAKKKEKTGRNGSPLSRNSSEV